MRRLLALALLSITCPVLGADTIQVRGPKGDWTIAAVQSDGQIWADFQDLADALGLTPLREKENFIVIRSSGMALFEPSQARLTMIPFLKTAKRPAPIPLEDPPRRDGERWRVSLRSLPVIFDRRFTYHVNKRLLSITASEPAEDRRTVAARHVDFAGKSWVSVKDLAKVLDVAIVSQSNARYRLVMPDFRILTIVVNEPWIFRNNERYRLLEDAPLIFSGAPFISLPSVQALFGIEVTWNPADKTFRIPTAYGRLEGVRPAAPPLTLVGYIPQPIKLSLDQWSMFYQDPAPIYAANHEELYESVRDFFTNQPIDRDAQGMDTLSGLVHLSVNGSLGKAPLTGGMQYEKLSSRSRLASGSLQWGFPKAKLDVGREYVRAADFENQWSQLDRLILSHSSDRYGEGKSGSVFNLSAVGGEDIFSMYLSTAIFSQTVKFRQRAAGLALGWENRTSRPLILRLSQYHFDSDVREISAEFNFFPDLFTEELGITVDLTDATNLARETLGFSHETSILDAAYKPFSWAALSGAAALSYFKDPLDGDWNSDPAWRARGIFTAGGFKVDGSHERTGARYRSFGDPLRYQNHAVSRFSPSLNIGRKYKIYTDFKREDSAALTPQGLPASRFDYGSVGASYTPALWSTRVLVYTYDQNYYGKRWKSSLDTTRFIGRHAVDAGAAWSGQWLQDSTLFKQSYTGRAGFTLRGTGRRFSFGGEFTRHHYPLQDKDRWESGLLMNGQRGKWKGLLQHKMAPRQSLDTARLHTGYLRLGREITRTKTLSIFGAFTGLGGGIGSSEVWRAGLEYVADFY